MHMMPLNLRRMGLRAVEHLKDRAYPIFDIVDIFLKIQRYHVQPCMFTITSYPCQLTKFQEVIVKFLQLRPLAEVLNINY